MKFNKISIFSSITILFSILFSAGVITLVTYSFLKSEYAIENLAKRLNTSIAQQVKQEFELLVEPSNDFFNVLETLARVDGKLNVKSKRLQQILLSYVGEYPQLYNIFIALPNGEFLMSTDSTPLKISYIESKKNVSKTILFDLDKQILKSESSNNVTYNPLTRPWYQGAINQSGVFATDVYTFFESQKPGVTLSKVIRNQKGQIIAVVGVDLLLTNLQLFLSSVDISKDSFIAIIDKEKGKYIVSKDNDRIKEDSFEMIKLFHKFTTKQDFDQIEFKKETYYFTESDVGSSYFESWKYVIAIPESELISEILVMRQQSLKFGALILVAGCIVIFLFSKLFSRPIKEISNQANKIKQLEKVASLRLMSPVDEVSELIQSVNALGSAFDSFVHYVPKTIVKHLLDTNQKAGISGQMYNVTILFTDIEGFTAFSDGEDPENVSVYLSRYFELLSEKVLAYGGTIDKYIGDSLMVFWGAPIKIEEHALQAVRCVMEIKNELESERIQSDPILSKFKTRFGLHSGRAVIGNIGSSERFNYTAIGSDVNICARLEALNKEFNTYSLISDSTKAQIGDSMLTRPLEPVLLKGVKEKVMVHELLDQSVDKELVAAYERCHQHYMNKEYQESKAGFEELLVLSPDDKIVQYYVEKIGQIINGETVA
tara:strand:- start:1110 stop:3083 length:1974 start_codon:yes stop_codon:yes gene_type:complete